MPAPLGRAPNFLTALDGAGRRVYDGPGGGLPPPKAGAAPQASGSGFLSFYRRPRWSKGFTISGVTRDASGNALGGCTVKLFTATDDVLYATTISDATTGAFSFGVVSEGWYFYAVFYKAGSPDVAGTTVNTLVGT